jgi:hypothetical protein
MAVSMCSVCLCSDPTGGYDGATWQSNGRSHRRYETFGSNSYDARPRGHEKPAPLDREEAGASNTNTDATWLMVPGQVPLSV